MNLARPIGECPVSELHGPGRRFVFWVQGCALRCTKRCINPEALSLAPRHVRGAEEVAEEVVRRCEADGAEGVTVLGGEPTEQAAGVAAVFEAVRRAGRSTMLYSGHTYEALCARGDGAVTRLLDATDLLVDGPFLEAERDEGLRWRGSRNQRVLLLTERYSEEAIRAAPVLRGLDAVLGADGRVHVSGMHDRAVTRRVTAALTRGGRNAR
ncbi:MAG: 4Fe-4S single cluster domain-containing protein [Deltaproteobacteria bacterium]|nr:4Fe-4S single cluster domain-containing protein [Deltaproteobacteria bacterium]